MKNAFPFIGHLPASLVQLTTIGGTKSRSAIKFDFKINQFWLEAAL